MSQKNKARANDLVYNFINRHMTRRDDMLFFIHHADKIEVIEKDNQFIVKWSGGYGTYGYIPFNSRFAAEKLIEVHTRSNRQYQRMNTKITILDRNSASWITKGNRRAWCSL